MISLIVTVFFASLLGSLHCAGMCGAFLAIALGDGSPGGGVRFSTQAAYHLGRLGTYLVLGTAAGALGGALNLASTLAGLQPVATTLAGVTVVAFGVVSYLRLRGIHVPLHPPKFLAKLSGHGLRLIMNRTAHVRAVAIGLLTTLLPCGWLYVFVATAGGTGSAGRGALTMIVFWAGTLPLMIALGTGVRSAFGAFAARIPALTCGAMIVFGIFTLTGRLNLVPKVLLAAPTSVHEKPACCQKESHL